MIWKNFNDYSREGCKPQQQKYGSITNGVGEIPLNGKGLPLTGYAEGEEIV